MDNNSINILGINFFNGHTKDVINNLKSGGLLVVPSGPGLATIKTETTYYQSLLNADIVIADSGFMALLWNMSHKSKVRRISGLEFLHHCVADTEIKQTEILLVNPKPKEALANINYLKNKGFKVNESNSYIAPVYPKDKIEDETLLKLIELKKPKYIIINLGGGVQEILGAYLKNNLNYKPAIICTGAAIAFLTGEQTQIPNWADRLFIGWFFRCVEKPKLYIPRYFSALKLAKIMMQYEYLKFIPLRNVEKTYTPQNTFKTTLHVEKLVIQKTS